MLADSLSHLTFVTHDPSPFTATSSRRLCDTALCSAEEEATCVKAVRSFLPHRTTILFTHRSNGAAAAGAVSPLRVANSILLLFRTSLTLQLTAFISCRVREAAASLLQQAAQAARSNPHGTQLLLPLPLVLKT
jgi:hypothetical protein